MGETFCSYISINNSSSFEARDVVIKVFYPVEPLFVSQFLKMHLSSCIISVKLDLNRVKFFG